MQILIITLGFFTTIVVTFSASSESVRARPDRRSYRWLAITLPALGTAVAALNAFYNPSQD